MLLIKTPLCTNSMEHLTALSQEFHINYMETSKNKDALIPFFFHVTNLS